MADLAVRPLLAADQSEWDALWCAYLAFYDTELPPAARAEAFGRLIDPETRLWGQIARARDADGAEGPALGLVHYIFHDHLWRTAGSTYLQDLFTAPAARGTGVGAALIGAVYAAADAAGVPRVYWLTQDSNATARRLYDRVGVLTPFIRYDRP